MTRKLTSFVVFFLLSGVVSLAQAMPSYGPYPPMGMRAPAVAPVEQGPVDIVRSGIAMLSGYLRQGGVRKPAQARAFLDRKIAPHFDFEYMSRWVSGPAWNRMNDGQRAAFRQRLQNMFITTLAQRLSGYGPQNVRVAEIRRGRGNERTVTAWIRQPNSRTMKVDFRFYKATDGWKIFDVAAGGSSAVAYYREYFKRMQRQRAS